MKQKENEGVKVVCRNKKARFDYQLEDRFEAGLVLSGTEVKSLRLGRANLTDAYARISEGEVWLINAHISPYPYAHFGNHETGTQNANYCSKARKFGSCTARPRNGGLSLIPLAIYFKNGWAKVELALARGKKSYDKRQTLKQKTAEREMGPGDSPPGGRIEARPLKEAGHKKGASPDAPFHFWFNSD